jgi:hypothetical protein
VGHKEADAGVEVDFAADVDALPLGNDPISAVDITADEVLQEVIAVEAATALSELGQPMARYPQRWRES